MLLPAVAWAVAVHLARKNAAQFLLVTVTGAICFSSTIFFSVRELTLALPLVAIMTLLLARNQPWTPWIAVLALTVSVVLLTSHEAILSCSLILAGQAFLRGKRGQSRLDTASCWGVFALSIGAVVTSLWTLILYPKANSGGFADMLIHLQPKSTLVLLLAGICLVASQLIRLELRLMRPGLLVTGVGATAVGVFWALSRVAPATYESRSYSVLIMVAFQVTVIWLGYRFAHRQPDRAATAAEPQQPRASWFAVVFLASALMIPLWPLGAWSASLNDFRSVVTNRQGFVDPQDSLSLRTQSFTYPWTNPTLSVVLRSRVGDAIIAPGADPGWMPFPLAEAHDQLDAKYTGR